MIEFLIDPDYNVNFPEIDVSENAGIDFYIPKITDAFKKAFIEKNTSAELVSNVKGDFIRISPHKGVLIPSGVYSKFKNDIALVAFNKSGVAVNSHLQVGACVVDSSFQGMIFFNLYNYSDEHIDIPLGKKVIQFLRLKLDVSGVIIKQGETLDSFYEKKSKRGEGCLGSTGE